ncbi:hypothetical protein DGM98_16340 [Xanthomonas citri]|uniref:Uncharacterized protein n=1 Tax=Xanthomonas citri pv. phaseoli var. fuscans TaxID=473423 RepID=A0AB33FBQ8_XANCI|nr:hypothetical protein DGM98_16340 [Xanthomonas citri]
MAVDEVLGGSVLRVALIRPPGTFSRLREKERQRAPACGSRKAARLCLRKRGLAGAVMVELPRLCVR